MLNKKNEYYEICQKNNWDVEKIAKSASELGVSAVTVLRWAKQYADETEEFPRLEINKTIQSIAAKKRSRRSFKYFWFGEHVEWDREKIREMLEKDQTSFEEFVMLVYERAVFYSCSEKDIQEILTKLDSKAKSFSIIGTFCEMLLENEDYDALERFVNRYQLDRRTIYNEAYDFAVLYYKEDREPILTTIRERLKDFYLERQNRKKETMETRKQQQAERDYQEAVRLFQMYLENPMPKNLFCEKQNISMDQYNFYLAMLEVRKDALYDRIIKIQEGKEEEQFFSIQKQLQKVVLKLKMAERSKGLMRFDLLDYYTSCPISLESLFNVAQQILPKDDFLLLARFYKSNIFPEFTDSDYEYILKEKIELDGRKDEKGFAIPGTGRMITEEEKQSIIVYLKEHHIPINRRTYRLAIDHYAKGEIDFSVIQANEKIHQKRLSN